ncbi:hypothetical protein IWW40_004926 [Coemansia sp. RSA 1250]|nr:hypothetical protein IWW40_004926 [Coemansia sp. RSA 1250]
MSDRSRHSASRMGASLAPDLGLHGAVSRGDIGSICYALLGGQPIDCLCDGLQPIHIAAMQDDPAVIEILLQNGADVNARTMPSLAAKAADTPAQPDRKSMRKLHHRTLGSRSSFSFLKYTGVGPISAPIGFTTGLHSMQTAHSLSSDVDGSQSPSNAADLYREYHNATPLHLAVAHGHTACIEVLLSNGAWTDALDSYGNTPVSVAAVCGNADVAALLCQEQSEIPKATVAADGSTISACLEATPAHCPMSPLSYCSDYRPDDTTNYYYSTQQLPSPNPSDRTLPATSPMVTALSDGFPLRRRLSDEAVLSPKHTLTSETHLYPRRHTAGEADAYLHYGNSTVSPAGSWVKAKHRDSSPIGMRSLAHSYRESRHNCDDVAIAPEHLFKDFGFGHPTDHDPTPMIQPVAIEALGHPARRKPLLDSLHCGAHQVVRNVSTGSRRERSYTDSVIERAWRSYLEHGDEQARENAEQMAANDAASGVLRPLPESWMWQQAAIAVRYRRSQSLSANSKQH